MRLKLTNRRISAVFSLLLSVFFFGVWGTYLFFGNCENVSLYEQAIERLYFSLGLENEYQLYFQASLFSAFFAAMFAWLAIYVRNLIPVIFLGLAHAVMALWLYSWDLGVIALFMVAPLLLELKTPNKCIESR